MITGINKFSLAGELSVYSRIRFRTDVSTATEFRQQILLPIT